MGPDLTPLNPRQREAVTAPLTPLLILAGPGTGKTTVLTYRIAHLVATGQADPRHLLAVTLTNRAACALRQRLATVCPNASTATIGTLHSLGLAMFRRFAERLGYDPRSLSVIDRTDQRVVVEQVLEELGLDGPAVPVETALRWLNWWKREGGWLAEPDETIEVVVRAVAAFYRRHNLLDFDDLVALPLGLLMEYEDVLRWAQDRFPVLIVDEVQDLDDTQYRLLALFARRDRQLTVVGDPVQNVYAWRGATLRPLWDLGRDFPDLQIVELDRSYRSTATILAVAAALGEQVPYGRRHLTTARGVGAPVQLIVAPHDSDEAVCVAGEIGRLHRQGVLARWEDCAILYRARWQGDSLEQALWDAGIPTRRIDANALLTAREVGDVLAYLRIVANRADALALARIINRPPRRLAPLERTLRDGRVHTVDDLARDGPALLVDHRAQAGLEEFLAVHRDLTALAARLAPAELLAETIVRSGYGAWLATQQDGTTTQRHLHALQAIASSSAAPDLPSFLADLEALRFEGYLSGGEGVVLSTIHRAKGMEFPVVFIVGWAEGLLPHTWALDDPHALEEELRLAYVALTRAMDRLYLSVPTTTTRDDRILSRQPSRFLDVLPSQHLQIRMAD
jgi:DNA helicase-2/ATP-dependent DNA helicase PcrA